jgi:predicted permease
MGALAEVFWQVITPVFLTASFGYLLARRANLSPRGLSRAAFYVLSPCLLFDTFSHTTLSAADLGKIAGTAFLIILGSGVFAWLLSTILGYGRAHTSAFVLVVIGGNTGNYGLPTNVFAFGQQALEPAILYYAVGTLILSTIGIFLVARSRSSARVALGNALSVPLTYAGLAGLLVWATGWRVPVPIERAVALAGQGAVPVMLLLLGVQLAQVRVRTDVGRISLAAVTKLIIGPLLGFLLTGLLGVTGLNRQVVILQASMPTAVMTTVLATEYDAEPQFAAGTVLASTLGSLVTVTLVLTILST